MYKRQVLTIAANYGGRWDVLQAVNKMHLAAPELAGVYKEEHLTPFLSMNYAPEPDLFIRTGGETVSYTHLDVYKRQG